MSNDDPPDDGLDFASPPPRPPAQPEPAPVPPPELELDVPKPRPSMGAVRSAARADPLPEEKKKLTKEAVREGAVDVLLNSFSILREIAEDFRSSDRYFKYKALVLTVWLMLVATSVGVSCAGGPSGGNSFGARLVVAGDAVDRAYMIKNDSDDEWDSVQITVNGKYYVTAEKLRPYGDISLSARHMFDEAGKEAPNTLVISEIHLNCSEGDAYLLRGGQLQQ